MNLIVSLVLNSRYLVYCTGNESHNEFPLENFNIFFEVHLYYERLQLLHQV